MNESNPFQHLTPPQAKEITEYFAEILAQGFAYGFLACLFFVVAAQLACIPWRRVFRLRKDAVKREVEWREFLAFKREQRGSHDEHPQLL